MKAYIFLALFLIFTTVIYAADSVTLTTYYPAPAGSYQSMRATKMCIGQNCHDHTVTVLDNNLYVQGNVGIGTGSPKARLDVAGEIKIGKSAFYLACTSQTAGSLRYDAGQVEYCDGTSGWKPLGSGILQDHLAENGYVQFSNGLILQWGVVHNAVWGVAQTVTFPIVFPNACWVGFVTQGGPQYPNVQADAGFVRISTAQASVINTGAGSRDVYWFAIGN